MSTEFIENHQEENNQVYDEFLTRLTEELHGLKRDCPLLFEAMVWPENRITEEEIGAHKPKASELK